MKVTAVPVYLLYNFGLNLITKADPNARTVHLQFAPTCLEGYHSSKQNIEVCNTSNRTSFKWDGNDGMRIGSFQEVYVFVGVQTEK